MKYFWSFLLLTLIKSTYAQSDTMRLYQIYTSHFSNEEKAEWTAFENNWNYFDYSELQKKLKVKKLSCAKCQSLFADVFLKIDENGKMATVKFIKGKKCGIECSEKEFINWFEASLRKHSFKSLKNKQFIARFGHALKC